MNFNRRNRSIHIEVQGAMFNRTTLQVSLLATTLACSAATATPSERWTELAAEFKNYDNVQFHVDIRTPPMADNPFFGPTAGRTHATVWIEPAKKRLVVQTALRRFVFPEGTNHDRYNPPEPIPEPILGLGSGLFHVLSTGFQGCTAQEGPDPKGYKRISGWNTWDHIQCDAFPKGWGGTMYAEHGKGGDGTPFLQSLILEVAGETIYIEFSGMIWNKPFEEGFQGPLYKPVPIDDLSARNLAPLPH